MYQLVKSEQVPFQHTISKTVASYRQIKVHQFEKLDAALTACDFYNDKVGPRHYILNEEGKEYYEDFWID